MSGCNKFLRLQITGDVRSGLVTTFLRGFVINVSKLSWIISVNSCKIIEGLVEEKYTYYTSEVGGEPIIHAVADGLDPELVRDHIVIEIVV